MNTNNNPYNPPPQTGHPPMGRMMSPRGQWQRRTMNAAGKIMNIFPNWLMQSSVAIYFSALFVVSLMYHFYAIPWYYMLSGIISVCLFFMCGRYLIREWTIVDPCSNTAFEKKIFWLAFIPRVIWMFLIYTIFMRTYGDAFGFDNADAMGYDETGQFVAGLLEQGNYHFFDEIKIWNGGHDDISDMGYGIYVGFIYWLTGSNGVETVLGIGGDNGSIMVLRLLKCLISAITVILVYRLAKRNFGNQTGRCTAVFCALWPNFWYYCGCHLKEVEMVFLTVLFVEQADLMLRSRQFTAWKVTYVLLIAAAMFTFRTPLALVAILAFLFTIVMSSAKVVNWGKRIIVGILALLLIGVTIGNRIQEQSRQLIESVQKGYQKGNMQWRAERKDASGNQQKFAKYASAAVFAPLIFTIPFPTMVRSSEEQNVQQLLNGGNFIKNILSGFVILSLIILLISGNWRQHLLPLSFMLGYILVLIMSAFAQSERFHQPIISFEFMFAAYGLSIAVTNRKYKRWFMYWCGVMFIAAIAWNWFKLAGRGLM